MVKLKLSESSEEGAGTPETVGASNDDRQSAPSTKKNPASDIGGKARKPMSKLRALRKAEGLTLEHLSELAKISPSYLSRLEAGDRRLNTDLIHRLASVFRCSPAELLQQEGWEGAEEEVSAFSSKRKGASHLGKDLPVFRLSLGQEVGNIPISRDEGSPEALFLHQDQPIDWAYRPIELHQVSTAFAVYLNTSKFLPKYKDGDLLLIHPSKPLSSHCSVMVVGQDQSVALGQFEGWEDGSLVLRSFGLPVEDQAILRLAKDQLAAVHRVIGTIEGS